MVGEIKMLGNERAMEKRFRNWHKDKQMNDIIMENFDMQNVRGRGYFNSKFNTLIPLSLQRPTPLETGISRLLFKASEVDLAMENSERVLKVLGKARFSRNQLERGERKGIRLHGNETIGENSIRLARQKNMLPVARKHDCGVETNSTLSRLKDKTSFTASPRSSVNLDAKVSPSSVEANPRVPHAHERSILAWSACVFPVILVNFPERKRVNLRNIERKRVEEVSSRNLHVFNTEIKEKVNVFKAATCRRDVKGLLHPQLAEERSPSEMLYPLHHGH